MMRGCWQEGCETCLVTAKRSEWSKRYFQATVAAPVPNPFSTPYPPLNPLEY